MSRQKGIKTHQWTTEEIQYLKEITPGRHYKEIFELMNKKFEYNFSYSQVTAAIKRYGLKTGFTGRFEKGHISFNKGVKGFMGANKTSFKKGNIPKNKKPVGSERVDVDGYTMIKVAEPNVWKLKHRVLYEKHHNVKLNSKDKVIFADGDKTNFDIENLILLNNNQLLIMNKNKLIKDNAELTKVGVNIAKVIEKVNELERR